MAKAPKHDGFTVKVGTDVNKAGEPAGKIQLVRVPGGASRAAETMAHDIAKQHAAQGKVAEVSSSDRFSSGATVVHMNDAMRSTAEATRLSAAANVNPAWRPQAAQAHATAMSKQAEAGNHAKAEEHRQAAHDLAAKAIDGAGDRQRDDHGRFA